MEKAYYTRFDLMAKYLYIKYKEKDIESDFYTNLYKNHIITFNNCCEDNGKKKCINDFINAFDLLISNIKYKGFDNNYKIPIGKNNVIINGAHRLMTSLFYNIPCQGYYKQEDGCELYNYNFFINRQIFPNLDRIYTDTMALEFIKLNPNMRIMITYPNVCDKYDNIKNIIHNYGYLYYEKNVRLNENGLNNLIKELYRHEKWIGGTFPFGINPGGKYNFCKGISEIHIYLINVYDLTKLVELKNKCRELYNLGKHSLHMSDYTEDTFRIASSLLNENSIHYLNNGSNDLSEKSKKTLINYFKKIENNNEDYCITSSIIMEMYKLRNANDVDYLHYNNNLIDIDNISNHNGIWLSYYTKEKNDIIYNPENHFYFNGFKFASLDIIKEMKIRRNEIKDQHDIKLIENL